MDRDDEAENVQTAMRPQLQQRSSIPSFVLIIFMLFLLMNHSGDEFLARNHHYDALRSLTYQLSNFTNWMNGSDTNFSMPDRNPSLRSLVESHLTLGSRLDPSSASYFPNITRFIRGEIDFHNITLPSLNDTQAPWTSHAESYMANMNMTEIVNYLGTQDWKATRKMAWSVIDRAAVEEGVSDRLAIAHGRIDFVDATSGNGVRLDFEGVHFIANGSVYGFAELPGHHIDIRYLPAIVPEESQNGTTLVVRNELQSRIDKIKTMIDNGVIDQEPSEANSGVHSDCGFLVYAQIEPSLISEELMTDVESELQSPTGKWTPNVSPFAECGMLFRFHHAEGQRTQTFLRRVINYGSISGVISLMMLALSCRHVDRTHSPAALQRLSVWTFYTQAIVDAVSLAAHITFAILAHGTPSLALIIPAFASSIIFSIEAHHATLINQVQAPGDALNTTIPPPRPPQPALQDNGPGAETAQSAQRPQTPPPLTARSFLTAFARNLYSDPQARICTCGRSSSLSAEYLIGMSICRLWFPFYFLANSTKVLDIEPRRWVYSLAAFVLFQVGVVPLQKSLGLAFFLPKRFATAQMYDYHPPMPSNMHDPEAPGQLLGDCSICMEVIHVEDSKQLQQVTGGLLQKVGVKKSYSVAPCHHIFHMECLERWLALKVSIILCIAHLTETAPSLSGAPPTLSTPL
ncbi:hypothetical protein F5J12DRAFT_904922 [Pisolithus orientalis]|uniref:uncharacterized protein n=1 Tax=Pisolithus orientalis TaxID=936130 RepID=UPI0022255A91|nr:uncharacterized protein F5J12DRAFT_904922 [Pisolithus orientalis]KAI6010786.1 hypothetical protein F5J12DRAFT_904922 [Pisolithus orientalis]